MREREKNLLKGFQCHDLPLANPRLWAHTCSGYSGRLLNMNWEPSLVGLPLKNIVFTTVPLSSPRLIDGLID